MGWRSLQLRWKVAIVAACVFFPPMLGGTAYFFKNVYTQEVQTGLKGLMNFADAKQQGVVHYMGQNEKLAKQLALLVASASPDVVRSQFRAIVETDVFDQQQHPFFKEVESGTRKIATWKAFYAIDYVRNGVIEISSDSKREGHAAPKPRSSNSSGYSSVYAIDSFPVLTFSSPTRDGWVYVHADARMLTLIVNGEIGNMQNGMAMYYLAGVGRTFDYYIVDQDNTMITDSRVTPNALLKAKGSEFPWRATQQTAGHRCGRDDATYVTNAGLTTFCRETMGLYQGTSGRNMLGASMPFYDSGWTLVVEQDAEELLQPLYGLLYVMGWLAALTAAVAFCVFVFVINRFVFPRLK